MAYNSPGARVTVALLLVAACGPQPPRHVVIGYAFPGSGQGVVRAAREEIARHPVPGYTIDVVYDSAVLGDPPDVEAHRAERFAAIPDLVAVVGHGGSRGSLAAAPVYNAARIPQIVPTSTSRLLTGIGPWTFVLSPNDSVEGALLARFAVRGLQARRATIFYVNDEYGVGLRDGALLELERLGTQVVDQVPLGLVNDLPTLLDASFLRGHPDVLIVAHRQGVTGTIARLAQERIPGMRVLAGDGALALPLLPDNAGPAADSIYVAAFWYPDSTDARDQAFVESYREATGVTPLASATMSWDAIMLLVQAIREVGADRAAIRRWLERLGVERPAFEGITGAITFRPDAPPRLGIVRLRHGDLVPVPFE